MAGFRGFPQLAGYSASKFEVIGFAQALRDELHGTGVDVHVRCPPPGDTPMVRDLEELRPIYELSPMFTASQIVDGFFAGLDAPGWIARVDARGALARGSRRAGDT